MRDPFQNRTRFNWKAKMLAADAQIDTGLYHLRGALSNGIDHFNGAMRHFSVSGWRYWLVQLLSGGLTMAGFWLDLCSGTGAVKL